MSPKRRDTTTSKGDKRKASGRSKTRNYLRGRMETRNVKTAKRRKTSSTRWLQRQLNDPYVQEAKDRGYRSRAVFKLMEIDDRYPFLKPGSVVVDLGAAPGSWTELIVERVEPDKNDGVVIGIDLLEMDTLSGAFLYQGDFTEQDTKDFILEKLGGRKVNAVVSDMAANTTGHQKTDHLRIIALAEEAWHFAKDILADDGIYIAKLFQGGAEEDLLVPLKKNFETVRHIKPKASRDDSSETYVFASGFHGRGLEDLED